MGFPAARSVHSRVPHGASAAGWQDSRRTRQADGSHAASRGRDPSTVCVCGACAAGDAVCRKSARNVWRAEAAAALRMRFCAPHAHHRPCVCLWCAWASGFAGCPARGARRRRRRRRTRGRVSATLWGPWGRLPRQPWTGLSRTGSGHTVAGAWGSAVPGVGFRGDAACVHSRRMRGLPNGPRVAPPHRPPTQKRSSGPVDICYEVPMRIERDEGAGL
jgi:hypothetical protein